MISSTPTLFIAPTTEADIIDRIFASYQPFFSLLPSEVGQIGVNIPLPKFPPSMISTLFKEMTKCLDDVPVVDLEEGDFYIVGDIHGNFHDLIRIFTTIENPLQQTYIFLGDYVDRGDYSLDCITLLFSLRIKYPKNFYLIRGNHEFRIVSETYGFKTEIEERYGDSALWEEALDVFAFLPLAVTIYNEIICLHGGIGSSFETIDEIRSINLPINDFEAAIISDIVWSDPTLEITYFLNSTRGVGCIFGPLAVQNFLKKNNYSKIIRGHQCVQYGVSKLPPGNLITVFSTSNYSKKGNSAGFIKIMNKGECIKAAILESKEFVERKNALFIETKDLGQIPKRSGSICMSVCLNASFIRPRKKSSASLTPLPEKTKNPKNVFKPGYGVSRSNSGMQQTTVTFHCATNANAAMNDLFGSTYSFSLLPNSLPPLKMEHIDEKEEPIDKNNMIRQLMGE